MKSISPNRIGLRRHLLVAFSSLMVMWSWSTGRADEKGADPAELVVAHDPPAFRKVLQGAAWDEGFKAALAKIGDLDVLAKSTTPESGTLVFQVREKGQAHDLGFMPGDIVTEIDGKPIYLAEFNALRTGDPQKLTLVLPPAQPRQATVQPGMIGFSSWRYQRVDVTYLRHGRRGQAWDKFAAVGAACCTSNPDLAETAWRLAIDAGYKPDELSDYCATQIAWRQGRNDDAVSYCAVMDARDEQYPALYRKGCVVELAISEFKLEQALARKMKPHPGERVMEGSSWDYAADLLNDWRQRPLNERTGPSPSELAAHETSLLSKMEPMLRKVEGDDHWRQGLTKDLAAHKSVHLEAATNFIQTVLEFPGRDAGEVDVTLHVKLTPTDGAAGSRKYFIASLINCDRKDLLVNDLDYANGGMLRADIEPCGIFTGVQGSERPIVLQATSVVDEVGDGREFTVRLLHAAGRDEVWINHQRVMYVPAVEQPKKIGFKFSVAGVRADVSVDYASIDERM